MLEARKLSRKYGEHLALDALDLRVDAGEVVALLGANGAGKTTTLYLFLGFTQPTSGEVLVNGKSVPDNLEETRRQVAYIPERLALYPDLTGLENLDYFSSLSGARRSREDLLRFMGEAGLDLAAGDQKVATYSKGMAQKVGIALTLAKDARALLLDEPLSGLDPKAANEFCAKLHRLREGGAAILMATHDLFRAKETADRVGIMKTGRLMDLVVAVKVTHAELEEMYLERMR